MARILQDSVSASENSPFAPGGYEMHSYHLAHEHGVNMKVVSKEAMIRMAMSVVSGYYPTWDTAKQRDFVLLILLPDIGWKHDKQRMIEALELYQAVSGIDANKLALIMQKPAELPV